jgi:hypothetical protein
MLCYKCNLMLGCARDNADILRTAIVYLGGRAKKEHDAS